PAPATTTATANEPALLASTAATSADDPTPSDDDDRFADRSAGSATQRRQPNDLLLLALRQPLHPTPPRPRTIIDEAMHSSPETTADPAAGCRRQAISYRADWLRRAACSTCGADGAVDVVRAVALNGRSTSASARWTNAQGSEAKRKSSQVPG